MNFEIINPSNTTELLSAVTKLSKKNYRFAAGCTDLLLDLKRKPVKDLTVINLQTVKDNRLTGIKKMAKVIRIGAGTTAHALVTDEDIRTWFPTLHEAALNLASTQIRQVATVGGNLCTASPSGDIACALMALNATCEILNTRGKRRSVSIREFFTGVRTTVLKNNELLYSITIPLNEASPKTAAGKKLYSGFIKIGTRKSMECSVVSLAYHIQSDNKGRVTKAGIAIGAAAPTIKFTETATDFLQGVKPGELSAIDRKKFADLILEYASPISDVRATAWYRKEVLFNISKGLLEAMPA
ncbi:MAG: FAD binding domain-containing protein [Crocinitomicaceae bacterium]|nr:FAD binding domain-containing protein [Crocinitomicaceae bacterium]MBK8925484.1 FAD binding domain-containing protein [Crocinitomicaceae bacterium]